MAEAKAYDEAKVKALFEGFKVADDMEEEHAVIAFKPLDEERSAVFRRSLTEEIQDTDVLFSAFSDEDEWEHVVRFDGQKLTAVMMECKIMFDPLPPTEMVEYQFEDKLWRISHIGYDACNHYRNSKFALWEDMIKKPVCEASLRRMIEIGLITTLFDHLAFPNPPEMEDKYKTKNEDTGKWVQIPHPVDALRKWKVNTEKVNEDKTRDGSYEVVQSRLDKCPEPDQEAEYWQKMLDYLRLNFPEEMERIEKGEKRDI